MIKKILRILKNPKKIIIYLASKGIVNYDDQKYIEYVYKEKLNKDLNLENPQTFNEKLQYLKLHDHNPLYTTLVDKIAVKNYIAENYSKDYVIPILKVYNNVKEIDFSELPEKFVLKTTHDSGTIIICDNKEKFNQKQTIKKLKKRLKRKYYYLWREWPYKNVKPKIVAEEYVADKNNELNDYKFYCFNGKAKYVMICVDRRNGAKFYYFDRNWKLQKDMSTDGKNASDDLMVAKPKNLNKMFELAEKLSKDFTFVRIDLYNVDGKIYFGEYTFYPSAGLDNTRTLECENILSSFLVLDKEKYK